MKSSIFLVVFIVCSSVTAAHEVTLKTGGKIKGVILEKRKDVIRVRTRGGVVLINSKEVLSINNHIHDKFEHLYKKFVKVKHDDIVSLIKIAKAAKKNGYKTFCIEVCKKTQKLDNQNEFAMKTLSELSSHPLKAVSIVRPTKKYIPRNDRIIKLINEITELNEKINDIKKKFKEDRALRCQHLVSVDASLPTIYGNPLNLYQTFPPDYYLKYPNKKCSICLMPYLPQVK